MKKKFKFRYQKATYQKDQALSAFFAQGMTPGQWALMPDGHSKRWWVFVRI